MAVLFTFLPGFVAVEGVAVEDILMMLNLLLEYEEPVLPNLGATLLNLEMGFTRAISAAIIGSRKQWWGCGGEEEAKQSYEL